MKWINELFQIDNIVNVSGLTEELEVLYVNHYYERNNESIIVLASTLFEATKFYEKMKTYNNDVFLFPMDDFLTSVAVAISPEFKVQRLEVIRQIKSCKKCIVVTSIMGYLRFLPGKIALENSEITIKPNLEINRTDFEKSLDEFGYNKTSIVTSTGEYAIRGFIIDIFPIDKEKPIRVELYGNKIESIRIYDEDTQITTRSIDQITIYPYKEIVTSNVDSLYNIMNQPTVFYLNNELIQMSNQKLQKEMFEYKNSKEIAQSYRFMYDLEDIVPTKEVYLNDFDIQKPNSLNITSETIEGFYANYELLKKYVLNNVHKYTVVFMLKEDRQITKIAELFDDNVVIGEVHADKINIIKENINKGFIIGKYLVISANDIESTSVKPKYINKVKIGRKIKDFSDINKGDYVVHSQHGIGIYNGVITLTKNGFQKDYILINYHGKDKVYIPVEKINTIYKYSDKDGSIPKIHKLGSSLWEKTKASVKSRIKDISEELIMLYAERERATTTSYISFPEEKIFEDLFEYEETPDQSKCIEDIERDLQSSHPMDRLLCGDVGFGKTEVAFRGIFKTVINGFQVAYLCPTTILSKQQYESALSRYKEFGINIALLNRFTTEKEYKKIVAGLKTGTIDIVFGTHRLLKEKVEYANLGMLIIDEEQRFGVTHKEKIKSLKNNVNVLTLSATPIPRTLKMAMSGLKDLSIIDTPPQDRYPIQTYVVEENDLLIKETIYKELSRGGQIYLLYNNVKNIENKTSKIQRLVPEARVSFAHGQMQKNQLETIIEDFVDNKFDVLICSTIIETGIDIANVNTLIVVDAQNFGLSQLYQLRGRVGRSNKIAYAYLMYNPNKTLTDTAVKRLKAIKEFTELGSGYKIALRDLSIRGAGDLLGGEQAGFINSVGIDLYTQMVKETMDEIKGVKEEVDENETALLNIDTHIEESYVADENIRIEIHKLINQIEDYKTLQQVKDEIVDRFGKIDEKLNVYMYEEWFEKLANKLKIKTVVQTKEKVEIVIPEDTSNRINGERLFIQMYNINPKFKISYQMKRIIVSLPIANQKKHFIYDFVDLLKIINDQFE